MEPPGAGLQLNISRDIFAHISYERRFGLTNTLATHHFVSIGLSGSIKKRKTSTRPTKISPPIVDKPIASDRDKDGILDSVDACPDVPGLAEYHGCPDSDHDGIPDNLDKCPIIPGFARYQGCPIPDSDGDGVNDEEDSCVHVPGLRRLHGCPEIITPEIKRVVDSIAKKIFFESGSYRLKSVSYSPLDSLVRILKDNTSLRVSVEGHTDNVGSDSANQVLSEQRSRTIVEYLVSKGISSTRLMAKGFGESAPIDDNNTKEGRAINRRVELRLLY